MLGHNDLLYSVASAPLGLLTGEQKKRSRKQKLENIALQEKMSPHSTHSSRQRVQLQMKSQGNQRCFCLLFGLLVSYHVKFEKSSLVHRILNRNPERTKIGRTPTEKTHAPLFGGIHDKGLKFTCIVVVFYSVST
jgi:hypothetical protein